MDLNLDIMSKKFGFQIDQEITEQEYYQKELKDL